MSNRVRRRPGKWGTPTTVVALRESATAVEERPATQAKAVRIAEATTSRLAAAGSPLRYRTRLIEGNRQGSSGWYGERMLREAASRRVFPAGLQMYADHPSLTEQEDRPERSIRDLAARLVTDAQYEGDGLYATIEVYPHWASVIEALKDDIGVSIRASGTAEYGKPEGQRGPLITALTEAYSVDFVTQAGAGGAIVSLVESARAVGLREATANELRCALKDALGDKYGEGGDGDMPCYLSVADFDQDAGLVWYCQMGEESCMFEQGYTVQMVGEVPVVTLADTRTAVVPKTVYVPAPPEDTEEMGDGGGSGGMDMSEAVSNADWGSVSQADYTPEAWAKACVVDTGMGAPTSKSRYKLPIRMPNGDLNRNGVHQAAARFNQVQGMSAEQKRAAARVLVRAYGELNEDPPPVLTRAAGSAEAAIRFARDLGDAIPVREAEPPTDVTGGAPPAVPNPPEGEEPTVGTQTTGPAPGTAGTADASTAALTEAQTARAAAETQMREAQEAREAALREAEQMKRELAALRATEAARPVASALLAESTLPAAARDRVLAQVTATVPLTDALLLDEAALKTAVDTAVKAEQAYLDALNLGEARQREAAGEGRVAGLGTSTVDAAEAAKFQTDLAEAFRRIGLDDKAAVVAAGGRR